MAQKITIDMNHTFVSGRGEEESVKDALAWYRDNFEDDDGNVPYEPADLLVYAVRRLRALSKDNARHDAGKLARRFYSPRLDNVKDKARVPRKLAQGATLIHEAAASAEKKESKPTTKKATTKKASTKVA